MKLLSFIRTNSQEFTPEQVALSMFAVISMAMIFAAYCWFERVSNNEKKPNEQ